MSLVNVIGLTIGCCYLLVIPLCLVRYDDDNKIFYLFYIWLVIS